MGHWEFDSVHPSSVRMEVTQADQFNNDEVSLPEALVRESIQNSSDAPASGNVTVKVRFSIRELSLSETKWLSEQLKPLLPHYEACGIDSSAIEAERVRVLVIEDFNTRGLTGSLVDVDGGNFDRFWRAVGDSGKKGKSLGRWGLGKLVYSSASALRLFYGLSITAENDYPALLGQVVLKNHRIGNTFHPAHGFFFNGRSEPLQLQQPIGGAEAAQFSKLGGSMRAGQTGLSLIIPYLLDGIDEQSIISGVITNYYFPILAGRLTIEVDVLGQIEVKRTMFAAKPASNPAFWRTKFNDTVRRDKRNLTSLRELGWRAAVVWECAFNEEGPDAVAARLLRWVTGKQKFIEIPRNPRNQRRWRPPRKRASRKRSSRDLPLTQSII